jgi:hypothetical protein
MTGSHSLWALAVYLPFAVTVSLVLIGKHMDKYEQGKARGVGTLPVRLGLRASGLLAGLVAVMASAAAAALYVKFRLAFTLVPLAAYATATASALILTRRKPNTLPRGWRVWPLWYVAAAYASMDSLGRGIIAGLLAVGLYRAGHVLAAVTIALAVVVIELFNATPLHRAANSIEAAMRNK